jgi:hypothetical protein
MAGKRAEPPLPESGHVERRREGEREPRAERVGPLTIARLVKADGRALILYSEDREARPRT